MKRILLAVLAALMLLLPTASVYASWAFGFVVYNDNVYKLTDETVPADRIGLKIGKVSMYTDVEGSYKGNYSNALPKDSEYRGILGIDVQEAIAADTGGGKFVKAVYHGRNPGSKMDGMRSSMEKLDWLWSLLIAAVAVAAGALWWRRSRRPGARD
ncbi:hypothetical protein [Cohnella sp. 56]|uniref:hypothetical protein n=1 Tax=Cohnella sp. 56 TaxID=3113722 RepID=UPI0030E8226C